MIFRTFVASAALALALSGGAHAAVTADSLPYAGTPDWTDIQFGGTFVIDNGTSVTLTTGPGLGNWFGWGSNYGNQPSWSPASSADGNYLRLVASFSADASDWSAYFYDGSNYASMLFNPTATGSYGGAVSAGVRLGFADSDQFVALDTAQPHVFEFFLKDGQVSYRVDGQVLGGEAGIGSSTLLVIGDGSGYDPTGTGTMTVHVVAFDAAPAFTALAPVPEPGEWAMMAAGLGLVGAVARRRKASAK